MGGKIVFGLLAVGTAAFIVFGTSVVHELGGIVTATFSPGGVLIAEMPVATSAKMASLLPQAVKTEPNVSAGPQKPVPVAPITVDAPVVPSVLTSSSAVSAGPVIDRAGGIIVSEIMVGSEGNTKNEFVELYNPTGNIIDLTGYSVRKKSAAGNESSLVSAARLEGKSVVPGGYFLLASSGGYNGPPSADVLWPASYSLAAKNNSIIVYKGSGDIADEVAWAEIPVGSSLERADASGGRFNISTTPSPQASQSL
ncbi:lamin tail domain-containing protein [Patescibacteria group bacterium]|nr:lamin tail domain-containing protein [Patescibacteria group bacterium]